ncbi:cation:dicarboxylate symporter family transporter [Arthrobacter sp. NicSoilC12]|uniref:cation:dicarboxylate symporter family transporter n=1 Tax=Arthrobacter sp. NicSoilC12 TaxID=2831001 RepID=UPI001CC7A5C6|nr:cation:dicarboxylase symporter family transporter [Arthrobacter sp. NicSoilC12]GIU57169.1 C4-dicarboxylate transporter DctA [Arthrobacter sp. NicSoilC12]
MASQRGESAAPAAAPAKKRKGLDKSHYLYIAVIVAVIAGAVIGLLFPEVGKSLKPLGDGFIKLIKMMIAPVIFCTIVLGIGSIAKAATVGKVGGLALAYFVVMSTFALGIGLVVGNLIHPGEGLKLAPYDPNKKAAVDSTVDFLLGIIPGDIPVLPTLLAAILVGFALQKMGPQGAPILKAVGYGQALVFRILIMIMWLAPVGAFGAIAAVVGATGFQAIISMATLMGAFYITCALFIVVVLGGLLKAVAGVSIFKLMKYLGREYLLIFSTSSSEAALPRLIAKMEHLGVSKPVVGVTVPTGYSFNLDGTAIYLTMAALFVANAMGTPLDLGAQVSLLVFMIIASKGAAGVTGAGLATLAAGLQAHAPQLLGGVGMIVGIDRFMSEARALTNFTGNAVATVLIGTWVKEIDGGRVDRVLAGAEPFDEETMLAGHSGAQDAAEQPAQPAQPVLAHA